jgi:hypothetical protein
VDYLCSPEARSAGSLGVAIGRKDPNGVFLDPILAVTRKTRSMLLLRGYTAGLLTGSPKHVARVNETVDQQRKLLFLVVAESIQGALESPDPATRIVRMVRSRRLGFEAMHLLLYGETLNRISSEQFGDLLSVFDEPDTPPAAFKIASDILGARFRITRKDAPAVQENPETRNRILAILEKGATIDDRGDFWWADVLSKLADEAPVEVARIAALAITGADYDKQRRGAEILAKLAESKPEIVMDEIGPRILDPNSGWKWQAGSYKQIFAVLSPEVVMEWLDKTGLAGAQRIAQHLPSPFQDAEGKPVVPRLTDLVLSRYGDDGRVFGRFCAGRHHLEASWGDPADTSEAHARAAEPFLSHPTPAIRRWAADEVASSRAWAARWRKEAEDERFEP